MKLKTDRKKIWLIAASLAAVITCFIVVYFVFAREGNLDLSNNSEGDRTAVKSDGSSQKEEPQDSEKVVPPNTDRGETTSPEDSNGKQIVPVVTTANVDGTVVYIRGGLNVLKTEGDCYAELTGPQGEKVRKDTELLPNAGTTDCKTIAIPTSELSAGKWSYTLNYSASDAEGKSSVESFTIL